MRAFAIVSAFVMAGCIAPDDAREHGPTDAWTDTEGASWFTHTTGCSNCGLFGSPEPKASTLVVYDDGSLLWYHFALGPGPIAFAPGLEPWEDEVRAAHASQHDGWNQDMSYVADVHATRVADWSAIEPRLQEIHDELHDPGPDDRRGCDDCAGPWVESTDPHMHAALFGNYDEGDAWDRLLDEFTRMRGQVDEERSAG